MAKRRIKSTDKLPRVYGGDPLMGERGSRLGAVRARAASEQVSGAQSTPAASAQPAGSQAATSGASGGGLGAPLPLLSPPTEYVLAKRDLSLPGSRVLADSDTVEWSTRDPKRVYASVPDGALGLEKLEPVAAPTVLIGRETAGAGPLEEIAVDPQGVNFLKEPTAADQRVYLQLGSAAEADTGDFEASGVVAAHATGPVHGWFKVLSAGAAATAGITTAQPWFPTAGAVTLTANKTYFFRGLIAVTRDNTGALSTGFGGTATVSSILAYSIGQSASANTNGTAQTSSWRNSTALVTAAPSANVSWAYIQGVVRIGTGGTLIPQFATSISATTTITVESGTFFELVEIGADTVTERGTWS
jgi:hypothetical protein